MPSEKSYIHYLSFLKCIGMFAVIGIHVFCNQVGLFYEHYTSVQLFFAFFLTNALRAWAVPIFVMVSGALFLSREIALGKMYAKYILRLVLVLLSFGTLYALMEIVFTERAFSAAMLLTALKNVYAGALWDHMWFIYMCIGVYIITPPLQKVVKNLDETALKYLLVVLFVFTCFVPFMNELTDVPFGIYLPVKSIWLFYYLAGYTLHTEIIKIDTRLSVAFMLCGVAWCAFAGFLPNMRIVQDGGISIRFAGPGTVIGVLVSLGLFSLAKAKCKETPDILDTAINPLSFGVYVVHAVFINLCYKVLRITPDRYAVWLMWTIVFLVTAVDSLTTTWLLRKIPFVRRHLL